MGFEGRYEVSDQGRVRSVLHRVRIVARGTESTRQVPARVLKPGRQGGGHYSVAIGKANSRLVHHLVMEAFVGPRPQDMEVLHIDHNKAHNALCNLRYGTRNENLKMDYAAGTRKTHKNFNRWGRRYE